MFFNDKETIIRLTPEWKGERLPDGRPKVSADILQRMRDITFEEAWAPLWERGYRNNWECNFQMTSPGTVLVGRAVTAVMVPKRPDLDTVLMDIGTREEGHKGFFNQWVIDNLMEDDVVVVDLYDKIFEGTYVGGNLSTAIRTRTKRGGAIIWGGVRDLQQIVVRDIGAAAGESHCLFLFHIFRFLFQPARNGCRLSLQTTSPIILKSPAFVHGCDMIVGKRAA